EITYSEGARAYMTLPTLEYELLTKDDKRGWIGCHEDDDSMPPVEKPVRVQFMDETCLFISTSYQKGITKRWSLRLKELFKPREKDTLYEFGLLSYSDLTVSKPTYTNGDITTTASIKITNTGPLRH
ncbi:hypothetical protein BC835DRAFT_1300562, partial [Cytidiella melzeri]